MPVVPMFHANCWGLAFTAPMAGATLVMPGAKLDGASIHELLDTGARDVHRGGADDLADRCSSIWRRPAATLPHLERVVIGGAACPRSVVEVFEERYDVRVMHAWGMTEMSPLGTICTLKPDVAALSREERYDVQEKQGHPPFGVELKVTDDDGSRPALGRQDLRSPEGARPGGRARLFRRDSGDPRRGRLSSTPATSRTSTRTATCASPTARRT